MLYTNKAGAGILAQHTAWTQTETAGPALSDGNYAHINLHKKFYFDSVVGRITLLPLSAQLLLQMKLPGDQSGDSKKS